MIYDLFEMAFKYPLPKVKDDIEGNIIECGGGFNPIARADKHYDLPEFHADFSEIPEDANSVTTLYSIFMMEHLENPVYFLSEVDRVLKEGCHANIVVPHSGGQMAFDDPEHKSFWMEKSWRSILGNQYYDRGAGTWNLEVHTCFIMAAKFQNLALFTQLVKVTK